MTQLRVPRLLGRHPGTRAARRGDPFDGSPWECPQCHCLFERPGMNHEPCGMPRSPLRPEHTMPIPELVQPARPAIPMPARAVPAPIPATADPLTARQVPVTMAAVIALQIPEPGTHGRFTVQCGCGESYRHYGTASFRALHESARLAGWDRDGLAEAWTCPPCQRKDGYWAPRGLAPRDPAAAEYALTVNVHAAAGTPAGFAAALRARAA